MKVIPCELCDTPQRWRDEMPDLYPEDVWAALEAATHFGSRILLGVVVHDPDGMLLPPEIVRPVCHLGAIPVGVA